MENKLILQKLERLEEILIDTSKEIINVDDLINYTGFARSYIYKLVHLNIIPFYKPNGKYLFFKKSEIDDWLLQNKTQSKQELSKKAQDYIFKATK